MQIDDFKFINFRSMYLWACLKTRNPRNPEMIHFRKPLDFWASHFGMSSRPQLTRNEKHWRTQITTTGCMGADFEGNKVCSNVIRQVFLISILSIPSTLSTGRPFSSAGSCSLFNGFNVIYKIVMSEYIKTFLVFVFKSLLVPLHIH